MFEGKKTYIIAAIWGLATVAQSLGWLTPEQLKGIEAVLVPLGLAALRAGVTKSGPTS